MRNVVARATLLFALLEGMAVPAHAEVPQASIQTAIKAENARWADAFKRRDFQAIGSLYTNDGTLLQPGGERVRGPAAIADYFAKAYAGKPPFTVTFSNFEFYGSGDAVTEVSDATILREDGTVEYAGKQALIFLKQGGAWKLHRDVWNDNGPAAAAR